MPDTAIAAQVNPPSLSSLSSILGIQQQRQDLTQQALDIQRAQIETQAQQGANSFFQNWDPGQHHGEDGTLDLDSAHASPAYQALSGAARLKVEAQLNSIRAAQLDNKSKLATLNGILVGQFGNVAQAASKIADPAARQQMLEDWSKQSPENARIYGIYSDRLKASGYNPDALTSIGDQAMDVLSQKPKPIAVGTGAATVFGKQVPSTGATEITGPTVRNAPPPGFSVVVDPRTNNPYLVNQQTGETRDMGYGYPGSKPSTSPAVAPAAPAAPSAPRAATATAPSSIPAPFAPGQQAATTATATATASDDAKRNDEISRSVAPSRQGITTANQILNLIDQIHSGKFSKEVTDYAATFAQHSPAIAARQLIGKYAAQLKTTGIANAATDNQRNQIEAGLPDPDVMNLEALRDATQYVKGGLMLNLDRNQNSRAYQKTVGSTQGLRVADDQLTSSADPLMYILKDLQPGSDERKEFIRRHFASPEQFNEFRNRMNAVQHYGGFKQ